MDADWELRYSQTILNQGCKAENAMVKTTLYEYILTVKT